MQPFVIRNEQDIWQAFQAMSDGFPGMRFEGWPIMRIRSSFPIDGVKSAFAVVKLQDSVHRMYGLLRYGTRNRSRLTALDHARTRLGVTHHDNDRGIDIDFTNAMNACVGAVEGWGEHGPYDRPRQGSIFAASEEGNGEESWPRTVRETVSQYIATAPKPDLKAVGIALGMTAIIAAAAVFGSGVWIKERSKEAIRIAEAGYETQVKLAELGLEHELKIVKAKSEAARAATPQEVKAVERGLDEDTRRVLELHELERPLVRFVVNEAEGSFPALMDMAPTLHAATYSINGFEMPGKAAASLGKALQKQKKAAKKRLDTIDGWEAQIKKTGTVSS